MCSPRRGRADGSTHDLETLVTLHRSAILLCLLIASTASAAKQLAPPAQPPADEKPAMLREVGIDQRLNERVPLDLVFRDEAGRTVRLGDYFGARPVVLALVYYECPMLCTQVLNGLVGTLKSFAFEPGREFEVVAVSFDPSEGSDLAALKKANYLARYGRPATADGWHFLTGDAESIAALTKAVGFRYVYDERIQQFAHGAALTVLTPSGVISRYFYGIEYSPRDLRLGLVEAAAGRIGNAIDQFLLLCYHYDPATGRYSATALGAVRLGGVLTVAALAAFILVSLRRERGARHEHEAVPGEHMRANERQRVSHASGAPRAKSRGASERVRGSGGR
jgi:protein SCO1/2